jgi:hypothetical protein
VLGVLGALLLGSASGEAAVRTKLYFCRRAPQPPVLDGALDEECWKQAAVIEEFIPFLGDFKAPMPRTMVRLAYDDENLYIAFECFEPNMARFREDIKKTQYIWFKDSLEIYLGTANDDKSYVQVDVNAVGQNFSERVTDMDWGMVQDDSFRLWARWQSAAKIYDDRWTVEVRLSLRDLGIPPKEGTIVGFNPCRFRFVGEGGQFHHWSPATGAWSQKNSAQFGHVIFGDPPKDIEVVLRALYPHYREMTIEIPKGTSVSVYSAGKVSEFTFRELVEARVKDAERRVAEVQNALPADGAAPESAAITQQWKKAQDDLSKIKEEFTAAQEVDEGMSLRFLKSLDGVEAALDPVPWDIKTAQLLQAFRAKSAEPMKGH